MKIIFPPHNKKSDTVRSWSEIKNDAKKMTEMIRGDEFGNRLWKQAFAISHTQVSQTPKRFFVINRTIPRLRDGFRWDVIINPTITKKEFLVSSKEGCMSNPYKGVQKITRSKFIEVKYQTKFLFGILRWRFDKLSELDAFIFQHEIDHMNGIY